MTVYLKASLLIGSKSVDTSEQRGLSRSAPAYESIYLSVLYGKIDIFEYRCPGILPYLFKVRYFYQFSAPVTSES